MKSWCLLLICLSCDLMRASADYLLIYRDEFPLHLLLAGFLGILLLTLRKRRTLPVATSTTSTTISTANPQPRCNAGYTLYSGPGRKFCFRFSNIFRSWDSAQTDCQMENAELPLLDNESLSQFGEVLRQQFPPGGATWLRAKTGVNRIARFIGGPNIPSNSPMWVTGEPNNPNECILLGYDNNGARLLDEPCGTFESYVCQQFYILPHGSKCEHSWNINMMIALNQR